MTSSRPQPGNVAILVALVFAFPFFAGCMQAGGTPDPEANGPPGQWSGTGSKTPTLDLTLGDPATSKRASWPGQFDNTPDTYDFNGDGVEEIIGHSTDRSVYVFSSSTGRVLANLPTTYPTAWHIERVLNGVQAAVLHPGQPPSLVVTNHAAYVAVWTFDATKSDAVKFVFHKEWERRMDTCHRSPGMDAGATLADLDGDGAIEILVQTEEVGFYALFANGTTLWHKCWAGGNSAPAVGDLDGNGHPEVVVASDSGRISVLAGDTGNPLWTFDATQYGILPASIPVTPTLADIDGVPPLEVLFTARVAPSKDPATFPENHMAIFAIRQNPTTWDSELVWLRQPTWANPMSNTKLVVTDVDGDGAVDILGMDWNTIGHYPGDWERLGPAHVFRLNSMGEDVWVREIDAWWSNQNILVGDSDRDGQTDVLVNGPGDGGDGLWRLSAATGGAEGYLALTPWKSLRGPVILDVADDGSMRLLVTVEPMDTSQQRGAILVLRIG